MNFSQLFWRKANGISVLVSCQDDHETLRDCVESFLGFGDEVVVITNRATEETIQLASALENEYSPRVKYIDVPDAVDLYQNRQAGLEVSRYRWVMRCDADYVAYEDIDGEHSVSKLRELILDMRPLWPVAIFISKVSLSMGWSSMYEPEGNEDCELKYIPSVYTGRKEARIYSQNPFLRFQRLGRWEGVPGIKWYKKIDIDKPYWYEVTIRTARSLLLRKARTDWRQLGDYDRFPVVEDYVQNILLPTDYPGLTLEEAATKYINEEVMPKIKPYDEKKYFPLPMRIRKKRGVS